MKGACLSGRLVRKEGFKSDVAIVGDSTFWTVLAKIS